MGSTSGFDTLHTRNTRSVDAFSTVHTPSNRRISAASTAILSVLAVRNILDTPEYFWSVNYTGSIRVQRCKTKEHRFRHLCESSMPPTGQ